MKTLSLPHQIQKLERHRHRIIWTNRFFIILLFVVVLIFGFDLFQWSGNLRGSMVSIKPSLNQFRESLDTVPSFTVPATFFHAAQKVSSPTSSQKKQTPIDTRWKVGGISLGAVNRALLQDMEGKKSLWVIEGDQLDMFRVKEIRDRSVTVEAEGENYEIRM